MTLRCFTVRVAVLDTGIAAEHPDLKNRIEVSSGYNFIDNNKNTTDCYGHGTNCAGTIGADTNNNLGVAGITWTDSIIPVKVYGDKGEGYYFGFAQGILYASGLMPEVPLANPAHVLNLSLGGCGEDNTLKAAVQKAHAKGVVMCASTGNENGPLLYPAIYPEVIAVGAVDYNYPNAPKKTSYSNFGSNLNIVTIEEMRPLIPMEMEMSTVY